MIPRFNFAIGIVSAIVAVATLSMIPESGTNLQYLPYKTNHAASVTPSVNFQDTSLNWRLTAKHTESSNKLTALTETLGSGVCVFDLNKDGWMDLFFVGGSGHSRSYGKKSWWNETTGNRLLLNQQGETFDDITEQAGLTKRIAGMGCGIADLNNDGHQDIVITGVGQNHFYQNKGDGTFQLALQNAPFNTQQWTTGVSFGDVNRDGLIDMYLSHYVRYQKGARTFEQSSGFKTTADINFDQTLYDPEPNQLLLNKGDFEFEDVTQEYGVANAKGRSLGAHWIDLNEDDWLDLIVLNDSNSPNQVFINQKGKTFVGGEKTYASFEFSGAHDLVRADFDNRGEPSVFMSRGANMPAVFLSQVGAESTSGDDFQDLAWSNGLAEAKQLAFSSWGSTAGDFNNDGWLDLYVANGRTKPGLDSPYVTQAQGNRFYLNRGEGQFSYQAESHIYQQPYSSRAAVAADLNNDGSIDLIVGNNNDPLQILENKTENQYTWVGLDLHSQNKLSDVYGARIEITTAELILFRQVTLNQNFLSQGDPRIHIGLGKNTNIDRIKIYWPNQDVSTFEHVKPNHYYVVNKANSALDLISYPDTNNSSNLAWQNELDEDAMLSYATVMLQAPVRANLGQLNMIWRTGSKKVKQHILSHIQEKWSDELIPIVRLALMEEYAEVVSKAIALLKQAELEESVVWLLPLLQHDDPEIQCQVADAFGFFFDEEEAVRHRKSLSITHLIKMLHEINSQSKACAANALAYSEDKRALEPLLSIIRSSDPVPVQSQAIQALGFVRDTRAIPELLSLVQSSDSEPQIVASALIALRRLNAPNLENQIAEFFSEEASSDPIELRKRQLDTLSLILGNSEGVVFSQKQLLKASEALFESSSPQDKSLLPSTLNTIKAGKLNQFEEIVIRQLTHQDQAIKTAAFKAMFALNTPDSNRIAEERLLKQPVSFIIQHLSDQSKAPLALSRNFLLKLADKLIFTETALAEIRSLLLALPDASASNLFNALTKQKLPDEMIQGLYALCAEHNDRLSLESPFTWQNSENGNSLTELQFAHAHCYFSQSITPASDLIAKRLALISLIKEDVLTEKQKLILVLSAAEHDEVIAETLLLKYFLGRATHTLSSADLQLALDIIRMHGLASKITTQLWETLQDSEKSPKDRLDAAALLMPHDASKVLNYLRKQT